MTKTYCIYRCKLCNATFAQQDPTRVHVCKETPEESAGGSAERLGSIQTTLDLTVPSILHFTLERLKFGEHATISPAGTTPGTEQAHE